MGRRAAAIVLVGLSLIAAGCSGSGKKAATGGKVEDTAEGPVGPQTYKVMMDAPSPEGQNLQTNVFLPVSVDVRPGDTVVFENLSATAPHTVTFGSRAPLTPEAPSPVTKAGLANPLVFAPCYAAAEPAPGSEACAQPAPASPPPYDGTGFWNSGIIAPAGAPDRVSAFTLEIASDTPVGSYAYACLLHRNMGGVIQVVEQDDERDLPAKVARRARNQRATVLTGAAALTEPTTPPATGPWVTAGWGDTVMSVNRFGPAAIKIKAGQSVTWKGASPDEPHTVTFESPFKTPEAPGAFTPGGVKAGTAYSGGFAHSGLIGPAPFPAETFSLVFPKPGLYSYVCVLHPGMAGQVEVTG